MACPICTSLFAMCEQAKKEALPRLTLQIKMQNITSLCWEILYLVIFEEEKGEFIHEKVAICNILSKMMNSPICLVHQMIHLLKCAKWTLSPKFPSVS